MTASQTEFAGLEVLGPGDPLSSDGWAFQYKNPLIIAALLKVGAVTHRHDAHSAMADPTVAPTVTTDDTGGSIPSGTDVYVTYTLLDPDGGESAPVDATQVTTGGAYADPTGAPTAALDLSAGTLLADTYLYALTVTDGLGGETALGPITSVQVPASANAQINFSGLTDITNTSSDSDTSAGWRLWRSTDGGNTFDLMSTGVYSQDTYTDDGSSPGDCSVAPPSTGTTGGTSSVSITVPTGQPDEAQFINVYIDSEGLFATPALLGTYPSTDAGTALTCTDLTAVQAGSPPEASNCVGGANQIDPDTDIMNWPWKQPVTTESALPTSGNTDGDARIALDTHTAYIWDAGTTAWVEAIGATGPAGPTGADGPTGPAGPPASSTLSATEQTGSYTLALDDAGTVVEVDGSAGAVAVTIPANADVAYPVGTVIELCDIGTTAIAVTAAAGVTLDLPPGSSGTGGVAGTANSAGQWATIGLRQRNTDEWIVSGRVS
jgi:hypothetical protein